MKAEKENLIRDLLDEGSREEVLLAGASILRRRRHWRAGRQSAALAVLAFAVTLFFFHSSRRRVAPPQVAQADPKNSLQPQVHALTDDELLALFPHTPVGLVSLADGKKRLVFPRPGDEAKFITKL